MSINLSVPRDEHEMKPRISVVGVGGAGGNAVNNMIRSNLIGCEFLICNTDAQAMMHNLAERRIQLGISVTRGLGAGSRPDVGRAAAEEALDEIMQALNGSNMVFITAGMGGGTGTGAAPVIARAAREAGILTVGVVTKPFHFEGSHRMRLAEAGMLELQKYVDTLIIIPNQNLFRIANEKTTFADAFKMADDVLHSGVRGVTDLMVMPGLINLDFADIRAVMGEMGKAMMGTGEAEGDRRAIDAAEAAISNPLLEDVSMKGARGVLINITGGYDMTLFEVDEAANRIRDEVDPDANIIWGSAFNNDLQGKIRVSVVATGIDAEAVTHAPPQPAKVFAFPGAARTAEAPKTNLAPPEPMAEERGAAPAMETEAAPEEASSGAHELDEPMADELSLDAPATEDTGDELLLDSGAMLGDENDDERFIEEGDMLASGPESSAPGTRSWITGDEGQAAPKTGRDGGTLFERMSNIARGAAKAQVEEEAPAPGRRRDPLDIPRFLGRQNNQ